MKSLASVCSTENMCQFWTKIIPFMYKKGTGKNGRICSDYFGGQLQPNSYHKFLKVEVGFNWQIECVFGSLKK